MTTLRKLTEHDRYRMFDLGHGKFEIVRDHINQHPEGVSIVLNILGHSDALVSDYTVIEDFDADLEALSLLDAKPGDYLWEIAERIEKEREE